MYEKYKNSYKVTEKELVSLSVYNVGFQRCDSLYQWGPGIRDHYLIHYIISGKGFYKIGKRTYELQAGGSFLVDIIKSKIQLSRCRQEILFSSIRTRKYCILRMNPIRGNMHG